MELEEVTSNISYNDHGNAHDNDHDNDYGNGHGNDHGNDYGNDADDNCSTTSKRSNGSEVWDFFRKVVWQKEKKTAKCTVSKCQHNEFSCGKGGTTRPLWRHLESAHWTQYIMTEEFNKKKKKTQSGYGTVEDAFRKVSFRVLKCQAQYY